MDTPGVLARPETERNPMEGLTLAAVEHLPSAVVFVMDLSGTSGPQSAPLLQLSVREVVRARYPDRPWLDVRSKADLPLADEVSPDAIPHGILNVSVLEDQGVDELRQALAQLVGGDAETFS
jgi:nucleolar GTP-binding protein